MAEITEKELRKAREAAKMTRWQAGDALGVSESTVERWETGEVKPSPEDVGRMEKAYRAPGLWYGWMYSNHDSFREHFPPAMPLGIVPVAVMNVRHQLSDVLAMQDEVERDALDGKLDDERLRENYKRELDEAMAAIQEAKERIK